MTKDQAVPGWGELVELGLPQGRLRYREAGTGQPIVFVHGLLTNSVVWHKVAPELARDFRCVAPDLPLGSHSLPMPADADLSPGGLAKLVADIVDALELRNVTLVGITAGGAICQVVAVERPEWLARLVLLPSEAYDNVPPRLLRYLKWGAHVPGAPLVLLQSMRLRSSLRMPMAYGWAVKRMFEPEVLDEFVGPPTSNAGARRDLVNVLRTLSPRATLAAAERLHEFDRPVLIIWSREDRLLPFEHAERLSATFPQARLEALTDAYCYVVQDQPQEVVRLMREFVGQRVPMRD